MKRQLLAAVLLSTSLLSFEAEAKNWEELQSGDPVTFLISADADQPSATSDKVIFSGGKILSIDATGCGGGERPVQSYVLVDPTGERSPKESGIIAMTANAIRPGTSLVNLTFVTRCSIGGVTYMRYDGIVE